MMEIAEKAIVRALAAPRTIDTTLPRAGRATLRRQQDEKRDVLHLLHATPALRGVVRGEQIQPIQDLVTLRDVAVSLMTAKKPKSVRTVPDGAPLPFTTRNGRTAFTVPELRGHQVIEIGY